MSSPDFGSLGQTVTDPYPYPLDDFRIYLDLQLKVVEANETYLYGILEYLRAVGFKLVKHSKWGYVMEPIIGGRWGWSSIDEWNQEKAYLNPYMDKIIMFLKELADD